MTKSRRKKLVLGLYPYTRGVAFAAFHAPLAPYDWGIKERGGGVKATACYESARLLLDRLEPDVIVLAATDDPHCRRAPHIADVQRLIMAEAGARSIRVHLYTRIEVRSCFDVGRSRYDIARAIAKQVHAFKHRLPPKPTPWASHNDKLGIFDAAALVMVHFCKSMPLPPKR
ncbi:MAG: hypothetical protein ISP45_04130 [Reyranella sp.]|nr:hypothetical protein [Reyranella sp.]MBL6851924.1 hypothetical protein [Alphaproteobacteria bacterium]